MQSECAFYNVQTREGEHGWHDVEGTEFVDSLKAIDKTIDIKRRTKVDTQTVNQKGAVVFPVTEEEIAFMARLGR